MKYLALVSALALFGCGNEAAPPTPQAAAEAPSPSPAAAAPAAEGPGPIRTADDGTRVFGEELDANRAVTALATVFAEPQTYAGQVVKTEGTITQVCQRMGCWMELRAGDEGAPTITVPMAGHGFFLPRDVAGKHATIQGTVRVEAMDPATQAHLRSEGATAAVTQTVQIEATSVVVHAS